MPSPAEYETETSGNSPTAAAPCALAHARALGGKLVRQTSVREEESSCLTPEIVIIKTGSLSRSCTEDTDRCGDSVQETFSPSANNNNDSEETKLDIEDGDGESISEAGAEVGLASCGPGHQQLDEGGLHLASASLATDPLDSASKLEFEVFEAETPGRGVSTVFICLYTALGGTILTMIILTVVFNFGMMLLLGMTVIIFIIIVILTNMCTMVYQL